MLTLVIQRAASADTQERPLTSTAPHGLRVITATGTYAPSAERSTLSRLTLGTTAVIRLVTLVDTQEQQLIPMTTQPVIPRVTNVEQQEA